MKKRNLLIALVMSIVMLFTACGSEPSPFVGTWKGTCDYTDYWITEMVAGDPDLEKYLDFEKLELVFVFEFTEDEVSLSLDEASTQQFIENVEAGMIKTMDAYMADASAQNDVTPEDVYAANNTTREAFMQEMIDSLHIDSMINAVAEALELSGEYDYDEEKITIFYEDNTYEEIEYEFKGDDLVITLSDATYDYEINCVKEAE